MTQINFLTEDFKKRLKKIQKKQNLFLKAAKTFAILGCVFLFLSFAPSVWYSLATKVSDFSESLLETITKTKKEEEVKAEIKIPEWQPAYDPKLTRDTKLIIPAIKVNTTVQEATFESYEDALKKGVWRVPDFGTPYDRSKPVILAAHRFGYITWSNSFRRENSFYNLPKLKVGDIVEIIYKQRKYTYEVYGEARGEEITDYGANLILYTCEAMNSKIRIFKYAKLLKI